MSDGFSFSEQMEEAQRAKARGPEGDRRTWCEECNRYVVDLATSATHSPTCISSRDREIAQLHGGKDSNREGAYSMSWGGKCGAWLWEYGTARGGYLTFRRANGSETLGDLLYAQGKDAADLARAARLAARAMRPVLGWLVAVRMTPVKKPDYLCQAIGRGRWTLSPRRQDAHMFKTRAAAIKMRRREIQRGRVVLIPVRS